MRKVRAPIHDTQLVCRAKIYPGLSNFRAQTYFYSVPLPLYQLCIDTEVSLNKSVYGIKPRELANFLNDRVETSKN